MDQTQASTPTVRNIPKELRELADAGFKSPFSVRPGANIECGTCHMVVPAKEARVSDVRRLEGQSDPADNAVVVAVQCKQCGHRGALVLTYGPAADADDADALLELDAQPRLKTR